jgi:hypothetical protein
MIEEHQPNAEQPVKLTDIARGLYHVASSTHTMMANQYISLLSQFFDKTPDGSYLPKTVVIQLPDETEVNLPLISLTTPKGLTLDKVNFDFSIAMDSMELTNATPDLDGLNLTRSSFKVEMAPRIHDAGAETKNDRHTGIVDVKMEFQVNEPPEGIMRLLDKFAAFVVPVKSHLVNTKHIPLLSPKFFFIARALDEAGNHNLGITLQGFSQEYTAEKIRKRADAIKIWEDTLLEKSLAVDVAKAGIADKFKKTYQYARIAFKDTKYFDKLSLSQKLSAQAREWMNQATHFYDTLLREEEVSFIFGRLREPEKKVDELKLQWQLELDEIKRIAQLLQEYDDHKNLPEFREAQDWLHKFNAVAKILLKDKPQQLAILFPDTEFFNK